MDLLDGIGIDDGTLPFRIAVLEAASGRSLGFRFDWPMVAAESLAAELDTPELVALASAYSDADSITIRELVMSAAASIGLRHPSPVEAIRVLGMIVSQELLDDSITPVQALDIVSYLTESGNLDWDLYVPYTPAYDWDEIPYLRDQRKVRREITATVKAGARELVRRDGLSLGDTILKMTGPTLTN